MRTALFALLLLPACTTIDDLEIPDPLPPGEDNGEGDDDEDTGDNGSSSSGSGGGDQDPEPQEPKVPGAWQPCEGWDDPSCSPAELGCYLPNSPGVELTGHCTWICTEDAHCADLQVGGVKPLCLPYKARTSACQLPCAADEECPEGMACHEVETDPGMTATICVWEVPVE